ncbi:hypothetical protein K9O30_15050 [Clostridium bowmanii]|uniref:hypothetical protein n=1 Tax=Clostridium bowmanii TaxID=132925 RepID=UPI001C0D4D53|nr:hypothetical protein [Clostridium bowmanii]MBU3190739.1 hypothetical protein [Clostridium bowmanii]MCA1075015.1 hypothetical protein [Clostridium bowmanii]
MKIQGLKKYCDKEGYIVEIFKNDKEVFKKIIESSINNIHSEVRLNKNKIRVDLIGEAGNGSLVLVEVSIRDSCVKDFVTHRNQLIEILEFIGKDKFAHIVLMSPNFLNEDIKNIEELIASYNVQIYFVYIPMELIWALQNHINIGFSKKNRFIYNNPIVNKSIKITSRAVNSHNMFAFTLNNEKCGNTISKAVLKGLREELYWHLAVHRYKNLAKNIIKIGTGTSDIMLNIYCEIDKIRVELDFAQRLNVFSIFKDYMADMSEEIGNSISITPNSPKIFTEISMLENNDITIDTAINIAKGYIEYATKMYKIIHL